MDEALISLGVLGAFDCGKHGVEFDEQVGGVDHAVLGVPRVDGEALEAHRDIGRVEAFVLELADGAPVDGIGERAAESGDIEQLRAMADLLVGAKADAERRVGKQGVLRDAGDERHDLRDARLVIRAQKRGAVGAHEVFARDLVERGDLGGADGDLFAIDDAAYEIAALVMDDMGVHAVARGRLGGVEMRDQSEARGVFGPRARRDMSGDIGVLADFHIEGSESAQLVGEKVCQVKLACRGRHDIAVLFA